MADHFLNMKSSKQKALLSNAENELDMPPQVIEKDIWVCFLLEKLFEIPISMSFKGGTSLSKVFQLIHRFSEDIDITIDYRNFKNDLHLAESSRSQLKKISKELKSELAKCINEKIVPALHEKIKIEHPKVQYKIDLSDDGENLLFSYPSVIESENPYLREHVLIEFGVRNDTEPKEKHSITPYLAKTTETVRLPIASVDTLSPVRTFWEKATLIHVECQRDRIIQSPDRLSRHWYDLYQLYQSWVGEEAFKDQTIFKSVIEHKKAFYNASYCNYDACLQKQFNIIPGKGKIDGLLKDYKRMRDTGMFTQPPPELDKLILILKELEDRINH
jgi:hypothetical protein